ncbi:MAG: hypothetical protein ACFFBU_04945 [Promethearchaeota archaeon]
MSEILDVVTTYLKSMKLSYEVKPVEGKIQRIIVPYSVPEQKLKYDVIIDVSKHFIRFWTLVMRHDLIRSKKKQVELYRKLLEANGQLAEVKYFITEKGDVGIVGHEGVKVLNIDGFREEFGAIPYGVVYFITTIAKNLNLSLKAPSYDDLSIYS